MEVLIIGGGNVGSTIAKKLISEDHDVTIIEQDENLVKSLNNDLDALVIKGNGIDLRLLTKMNSHKVELFLAVTNSDMVNIISCSMVKKITGEKAITVAKVEDYFYYFLKGGMDPSDFGVDEVIAATQISIDKISTLIDEPKAVEHISFMSNKVRIVGIELSEDYKYIGFSLSEIMEKHEELKKIRMVAVLRKNKIIIPNGSTIIETGDKVFTIGKSVDLEYFLREHHNFKEKINKVIIIGGDRIGRRTAEVLAKKGKTVIIVEEDKKICKELSEKLDNVMIVHGSGTDKNVLEEIGVNNSCVVATTRDDEYNIISSIFSKNRGCLKNICLIRNVDLAATITQLPEIDTAFSPDILTTGEVLRFCRKGDIITVTSFSEIDADIMKIKISSQLTIINKTLAEIDFPDGSLVGAIIRDEKVIIPTGNDKILFDDILMIFSIPKAINDIESMFSMK